MEVQSALALVGNVIFKPDWKFEAVDYSNRFESGIKIKITYPARRSERELAEDAYPEAIPGGAYAEFVVLCGDCDDQGLYRKIIDKIIDIETHEIREFFRVKPTMWAPFHPHRMDGMKSWGTFEQDLLFGVA